jgi:hypothetical protein
MIREKQQQQRMTLALLFAACLSLIFQADAAAVDSHDPPESAAVSAPSAAAASTPDTPETSSPASPLTSAPASPPTSTAAAAEEPREVKQELDQIDRKLMLKYIELGRYNILFFTAVSHHQWWRAWTYPISRESGTAISLAGTLTDLSQRARGLRDPGRISKSSTRRAATCSLIGNTLSGTASGFELAQNIWEVLLARRKGYSPAASVEHVREIIKATNDLLRRREELTSSIESEELRDIRGLETMVFEQIQEQLEFEFRKWSCFSREREWRENTFYSLDIFQNFTGTTSSVFSLRAYNNPHLRRPAVILTLVSNSVAAINPFVSQWVGRAVNVYQKKRLSSDFPIAKPEMPEEISIEKIKALKGETGDDTDLSRVAFLAARAQRFDRNLNRDITSITRLRAIAQQKAVSGPLIGLTSVARSTLENVAVFAYGNQKVPATKLSFAGRIPQAAGQTYAISNTIATRFLAVLKNKRLKAKGELPAQVFARRLKEFDDLEAQVRAGKI